MKKPIFNDVTPGYVLLGVLTIVILAATPIIFMMKFPKPVRHGLEVPTVTVKIPFTTKVAANAVMNNLGQIIKVKGIPASIYGSFCKQKSSRGFYCDIIIKNTQTGQYSCVGSSFTVSNSGKLDGAKYGIVPNAECGIR